MDDNREEVEEQQTDPFDPNRRREAIEIFSSSRAA